MVKKRNLPPLLRFSALLVCILPHCRLRDWCGNLRKASGHVVCRLDQSESFRIFDSIFYFPHSAIPHFTHSLHGPCMPSASCVHTACAHHYCSRSFSQSSSQSSPTLLQRGGVFRRLLIACASRHSFVELLDLVCGSL